MLVLHPRISIEMEEPPDAVVGVLTGVSVIDVTEGSNVGTNVAVMKGTGVNIGN